MDNDNNTIEYANENWRGLQYTHEAHTPRIVRWVIEYSGGLVKDEKQAHMALVCIVLLLILSIPVIFLFFRTDSGEITAPPGFRVIHPESGPPYLEQVL
jgi:hypothetical protein